MSISGGSDHSMNLRPRSYSLGSKPTLDIWVSKWQRQRVAKRLHIYYEGDFMPNYTDVYEKLCLGELSEEQRLYCQKVKEYLLPIESRLTTSNKMIYHPEMLMAVLTEISNDLVEKEKEEFIRFRVARFLKALISLMEKIKIQKKVYEGGYTRLFERFAEMCCLHTEISYSKEDQVVWKNFIGLKEVISRPDIRLFKYGVTTELSSITGTMLVSVVEVKKDSRNDSDELEEQLKSLESTHLSSSCSHLSNSETEDKTPSIEINLNEKVLGQHAGELLLDIYQYCRDLNTPVKRMPGMIVDGTNVFLTLLEISDQHFRKLEQNQELDPADKATIYYCKPLNILEDDERNILIEILMRLNNLEFHVKK